MSKRESEELVEVRFKAPKNVMAALREFVLKHDRITEEKYWARETPGWVIAEIDCICGETHLDPKPILKKYGLMKYYHDC